MPADGKLLLVSVLKGTARFTKLALAMDYDMTITRKSSDIFEENMKISEELTIIIVLQCV